MPSLEPIVPRDEAPSPSRTPWRTDLAKLLKLAGPIIGATVGTMLMGLTDTIVVGRYSAQELAYHALAWSLMIIVLTLTSGLLAGTQVMAARALGEGARHEVGAVLRRAIVYALRIGFAGPLLLAIAGPWFLRHAGLADDLAAGASRVLLVFCLALPVHALSTAANSWLQGVGRPTPGFIAMCAANLVNLGVVLVLVPGRFGLPALGAMGAAFATLTAQITLVLFYFVYISRLKEARALGVFQRPDPDPATAALQRRIGYGAGLSSAFEMAAFSSLNLLAGWIGSSAVAAWAVVQNVSAVAFMGSLGLSIATSVMIGQAAGAGNREAVRRIYGLGAMSVSVAGLVLGLLVWVFAQPIARVYTTDPTALAGAIPTLALGALAFWADGLLITTAQALRARADVVVPTVIHMIGYGALLWPLAWSLAFGAGQGLHGIIVAAIVVAYVTAAVMIGRFLTLDRGGREGTVVQTA